MKKERKCFRVIPRWLCHLLLSVKIVLVSVSFSFAQQNTDRVNLDMKNASLSEVFDEIKRQTKLSFMFSNDDVKHVQRKDYLIKNSTFDAALKQWFSDYVQWLRNSKFGIQEKKAQNNHGTWYSAQIAAYSLYTGELEYVKEMVEFGKGLVRIK